MKDDSSNLLSIAECDSNTPWRIHGDHVGIPKDEIPPKIESFYYKDGSIGTESAHEYKTQFITECIVCVIFVDCSL